MEECEEFVTGEGLQDDRESRSIGTPMLARVVTPDGSFILTTSGPQLNAMEFLVAREKVDARGRAHSSQAARREESPLFASRSAQSMRLSSHVRISIADAYGRSR